MKERCDREMAAALLLVLFRGNKGVGNSNPKQLNNQQRGQHRRLGKAHGAREDPEAASFRRARNAPWAALAGCIMPSDLFGHTMSGHNWGPHKVATLWGKEKQTERLSFRACAEAKDTQFVLTQGRRLWRALKAVKTPSTSCESCQALSALFPIAGARAANTAEKKTIATIVATTKGKKSNFEPA